MCVCVSEHFGPRIRGVFFVVVVVLLVVNFFVFQNEEKKNTAFQLSCSFLLCLFLKSVSF